MACPSSIQEIRKRTRAAMERHDLESRKRYKEVKEELQLCLRRLIEEAADEGYDTVTWRITSKEEHTWKAFNKVVKEKEREGYDTTKPQKCMDIMRTRISWKE